MTMAMMNGRAGRAVKGGVLALSVVAFGAPEAFAGPNVSDGVRAQKLGAYTEGTIEEQGLVEQVRRRRRGRRGRRGAGLAVLGGILALGTIAAIAESNRRDRHYDRYYEPRRNYHRGRSCGYWADQCAQNWGYRNNNYYGCLRYYGC